MRAAGSGLAADETIGMSAAGATHQPSRQKPRFLPAAHGVMSAEIASGNFSQSTIIRALFTAEDP
jgi:hypothetical protein